MGWLSAAERLAAIDRSAVRLEHNRCLNHLDSFSNCQICSDICPSGAIQSGKSAIFNSESCVSCLACMPACPVGVFTADDAVQSLLDCAVRVGSRQVELLCEVHPEADRGPDGPQIAIQLRGCLAGLGAGAYLGLAAVGVEKATIRIDACGDCPWESLTPQIDSQVKASRELLSAMGRPLNLEIINVEGRNEWPYRPYWQADNPPLTRRDLFRMATRQGQKMIGRAIAAGETDLSKGASRDRNRIISAVKHLQERVTEVHPQRLEGFGFAQIGITEACTACGACARVCPTGSLSLEGDESAFRLRFEPEICVACETCLHVCSQSAILMDTTPTFSHVFDHQAPLILSEGELVSCRRCGARFASSGEDLCPPCAFRVESPFGSILPPGFNSEEVSRDSEASL